MWRYAYTCITHLWLISVTWILQCLDIVTQEGPKSDNDHSLHDVRYRRILRDGYSLTIGDHFFFYEFVPIFEIVVGIIVKRSISFVHLLNSVDKRQLPSRELISPLTASNMINFESWQHTIRCRYSYGSVLLNLSLLDESLTLILSGIHYSMMFLFIWQYFMYDIITFTSSDSFHHTSR